MRAVAPRIRHGIVLAALAALAPWARGEPRAGEPSAADAHELPAPAPPPEEGPAPAEPALDPPAPPPDAVEPAEAERVVSGPPVPAPRAPAAPPGSPAPGARNRGFVEAGAGRERLTGGQPGWSDEYVRAHVRLTPSDAIQVETSRQSHFGDRGTWFGLGFVTDLNDRWYASWDAGGSDRGFFLPRVRLGAAAHLKWLSGRNLVSSLGVSWSRARDGHEDLAADLELAWHLDAPWIVQAGVRLNSSSPGDIRSARGRAALAYGRDQRYFLTLAYDAGRESYQLIAEDRPVTDFPSAEVSLVWRQWLAGGFGLNARGVRYSNPTYRRWGLAAGLFWEF